MILKATRHQSDILILDEEGHTIAVMSGEMAFGFAQRLLDLAGQVKVYDEEEVPA